MKSNCSSCGAQLPQRSTRLERHIQTFVPFHCLSVSNLPPTELELSKIQTAILPPLDQDIVVVDSAITAARLALESLEQERDALKSIKRDFENIISVRRRIPPEIWSEIFLYGDSWHDRDPDEVIDWTSRIIWQLRQVCQTWRKLALSLHSCWSVMVLRFSERWPASEKDVELTSFVLECSRPHLLDITLIHRSAEDFPVPNRMREMVFAESYRWRTAHLFDYHPVRPELLYAPLRGRLPLLEHLDFQSDIGMDSDNAIISIFKDCPRLVNVTLITEYCFVEVPVKQLTCLRFDEHEPSWRLVELIGQCSLLESLHVEFDDWTEHPLLQSVTLPCLRNLNVLDPHLLDCLTLPRLEVAAFDQAYRYLHPNTLYSFYRLIQRSNCARNLTELQISHASLSLHQSEPHLLLSLLSQTTGLAKLKLSASVSDDQSNTPDDHSVTQVMDVMRALEIVPGHHRVAFLPRLVSLQITVTGHKDLDCIPYLEPYADFVAMLKVRHAAVGLRLKEFGFNLVTDLVCHECDDGVAHQHRPVFNDDEWAALRGLAGDGMSLNICFPGIFTFQRV
ncbi:hypothetical protein CPB85DRAFT_1324319 [Mucidula mucida]|nr:hypothetical protein CPB85DRAFT_1324319 [Mucidula mucida]